MSDNTLEQSSNQDIQALEINARMLDKLASIEQQKIDLENKRIEAVKQKDIKGYDYSVKVLETKKELQKSEQELAEKFFNKAFNFTSYCVTLVIILIIISFYFGKEQFVYDCLKVIVALVIGWFGGYSHKKQSDNTPRNN